MQVRLKFLFWISFAIALAVYATMVLWTLPAIRIAASGQLAFDMRPMGYSLKEAKDFLAALSPAGRSLYAGPQRWMDAIYPGVLALTLGLGIWFIAPSRPSWLKNLLPILAVPGSAFDYWENILVAQLLKAPVEVLDSTLVKAASTASVLKSICTTVAMTVLLALAASWSWRRFNPRRA